MNTNTTSIKTKLLLKTLEILGFKKYTITGDKKETRNELGHVISVEYFNKRIEIPLE